MNILITAGPTIESIDPVRFFSNNSTGKMGFALAEAAQALGHQVTLIAGPVCLEAPAGINRIDVNSALEMHAAVMENVSNADVFISAAAVADYRPKDIYGQKFKKSDGPWSIEMVRNPDILAEVGQLLDKPFTVGFAAETENVLQNGLGKLKRKNADMIAINDVSSDEIGFGSAYNALTVIWPNGQHVIERAAKRDVAAQLLALIEEHYANRSTKGAE